MSMVRDIGERVRRLANPVVIAVLCAYFAYHAVEGERGVHAWIGVSRDLADARAEAARLAAEKEALEHKVRLLSDAGLDRDMLDERARYMLNVGRPDEIVIFGPPDEIN